MTRRRRQAGQVGRFFGRLLGLLTEYPELFATDLFVSPGPEFLFPFQGNHAGFCPIFLHQKPAAALDPL